jgi:hypothetical protein
MQSRRWPKKTTTLPNGPDDPVERTRGGWQRVARRFLPASLAANQIRLDTYNPRRALSRRRLARLIDVRRVVS